MDNTEETNDAVNGPDNEVLVNRVESLKASLSTLKKKLDLEKQLWIGDCEKLMSMQIELANCRNCQPPHERDNTFSSASEVSTSKSENSNVNVKNSKKTKKKRVTTKICENKLDEIENMCNLELNKLQRSLECLQPLKQLVTEWAVPIAEDTLKINDIN